MLSAWKALQKRSFLITGDEVLGYAMRGRCAWQALRHWTGSLTISTGVLPSRQVVTMAYYRGLRPRLSTLRSVLPSRQIFLKLPSAAEKIKCNHCISEIRGLKSKTSPNLCKIGTFYRDAPKERVTKTLFPPYFDRFSRKIVNFYVILLAETYIAKRDQEARTYISFPFIYCGGISAAKLRCGEMEARNAADGIPAKRPPFRVQPRRGAF